MLGDKFRTVFQGSNHQRWKNSGRPEEDVDHPVGGEPIPMSDLKELGWMNSGQLKANLADVEIERIESREAQAKTH
jgi:hypothetical protein